MSSDKRKSRGSFAHYIENIQSRGRYTLSKQELISSLGISENAFQKAAHRLIRKKRLMRVSNEFYVIIPFEYRNSEGLPATHYIDALMKFRKQPYYIGILSAASLHGAAHQAPQELQVVTTEPLTTIRAGRARIRFLTKGKFSDTPIQPVKIPTGYIQVSTPEATAFDLLRYPHASAGFNNIATVLIELSEVIDVNKLGELACTIEPSYVQRLGYLLDLVDGKKLTKPLLSYLKKKRWDYVLLRPGKKNTSASRNKKWRIIINEEIEVDQ